MPLRIVGFDSPSDLTTFVNGAQEVTGAVIVAGGTGYNVDDILDVVGGDAAVVARLKVTAELGNVITGIAVEVEGAYLTNPTNPVAVVGPGNDDATFNLTLAAAVLQADLDKIEQRDGRWYTMYWV